jgi:hypothetical protein
MLLHSQAIFSFVTGLFLFNSLTEETMSMDPSSSRSSANAAGNSSNLGIRAPQVPLDVETYPVAPPELELEQVHVFVRHGKQTNIEMIRCSYSERNAGERTPVGVRMSDPPASIPEHWMMCKTGRQFRSAVASYGLGSDLSFRQPEYGEGEYMTIKRIVERADGLAAEGEWCVPLSVFSEQHHADVLSGFNSMLGELTDVGRQVCVCYPASCFPCKSPLLVHSQH